MSTTHRSQHYQESLIPEPREHWAQGVGELAAVQATAERVITHARKILNGLDT